MSARTRNAVGSLRGAVGHGRGDQVPDVDRPIRQKRLFVLCSQFPVPSETFVIDHVLGMAAAGWKVTVAARRIDWAQAERICTLMDTPLELVEISKWSRASGYQRLAIVWHALRIILRRIPLHLLNRAAWTCAIPAVELEREIRVRAPQAIHAHFGQNGVTAVLAADLPTLVNFHGHDFTSWVRRRGSSLYKDALQGSTIVAHSEFAERSLLKLGLRGVKRVTMGVDLGRFVSPSRAESWPRPLRLVSVGRLVPQKGHHIVLGALAQLRNSCPELDVRLRIVGSGPDRKMIRTMAEELGVSDYVDGPTAVPSDEMPLVYNAADVMVVASQSTRDGWKEAFCRAAVEGMACGIPVVATPCGGLSDTVGFGGVVASDESSAGLVTALMSLLSSGGPAYWQQRARKSAERFGIDRMQEEYLKWTELCCGAIVKA